MAIDLQNEEVLSLAGAARACPAVDGKRPHAATIWRWMEKGAQGVTLDSAWIGRRRVTTREALSRFFAATSEARAEARADSPKPTTSNSPRRSGRRRRDLQRADKVLSAAGI